MSVYIRYEPDPDSERDRELDYASYLATLTPKARARLEKFRANMTDIREPNEPDYITQHGVVTVDLKELRSLVERHFATAQDFYEQREIVRRRWRKTYNLMPAEFYPRLLSKMQDVRSTEDFDWAWFEPVYPLRSGFSGMTLFADLLEEGQGEAWCKVCERGCLGAEVDVCEWWDSGSMGDNYICPQGHVLLHLLKSLTVAYSSTMPVRIRKRERRPGIYHPPH